MLNDFAELFVVADCHKTGKSLLYNTIWADDVTVVCSRLRGQIPV